MEPDETNPVKELDNTQRAGEGRAEGAGSSHTLEGVWRQIRAGLVSFSFLQLICNVNEKEGIKNREEKRHLQPRERGFGWAAATQGDAPAPPHPSHPIRADPNQAAGTGSPLPALFP